MKKFSYIIVAVSLMMGMTACNDLLDQKPYGQFTEDMMDDSVVEGLLASAYAGLEAHFFGNNEAFAGPSTNWIFDVRSDDALKGGGGVSMEGNIHQYEISNIFSDNVSALDKWKNNYYAISRVHRAMLAIQSAESIKNKDQYLGELKVLRAYYYHDLVRLFKYLPYITENDDASTIDNKTYTQADIWGFIQKDLREAYAMMNGTAPAPGRFNKYAAAALMAKACAYTQQWDSVIVYADYVINSGEYQLYRYYQDMSKIDCNNTCESIIAMQCSTADDNAHINWSNLLNVTYSDGNLYGTGDDFFYASQNLVDAFRTDASGLPYLDNAPATHITENYTGNIDPRLDFTVGRIGFPFRGYSYTLGWCRTPGVYGQYSGKKNCIDPADTRMAQGWPWGASPLNYCFLRYADLLLLKAEACVEKNDLATALSLVNDIRAKADRSIDMSYLPVDLDLTKASYEVGQYPSFASQDYARKAVRMERRLELAMEGHRWFDLVRWGIAVETMNKFFQTEVLYDVEKGQFIEHPYYREAQMTEDELYLPTPYEEVVNSNGLYQ